MLSFSVASLMEAHSSLKLFKYSIGRNPVICLKNLQKYFGLRSSVFVTGQPKAIDEFDNCFKFPTKI